MGGFAWLSDDEQIRAIEIIISEVNGAIPVVGGLGECGSARAVAKARAIARAGVSHLSMLPPFYYFASQEQIIAYFSDVASASDIPVVLYDNPVMTKNKIQPKTVAALVRRIPHLVGMKESDSDMVQLQELVHICRDYPYFAILTGHEWFFHQALHMGCAGGVGGLYNLCPQIAVALYEAFQAQNHVLATWLQRDLIDTWQIFTCGAIWGGFDEALRHLGLCEASYRRALCHRPRRG